MKHEVYLVGKKHEISYEHLSGSNPVLDEIYLLTRELEIAGFFSMILSRAGIPPSMELAYFPTVDGAYYWTGVSYDLADGKVAILLPLDAAFYEAQKMRVQGPVVLITGKVGEDEVSELLERMLVGIKSEREGFLAMIRTNKKK